MFVAESPFIFNEQCGKRCANSIECLEEAITSEIEEVTLSRLSKAEKKRRSIDRCRNIGVDFRAAPQTLDNLQPRMLDLLREHCAYRAGKTIYRVGAHG
jgi:hypothetical protein